LDKKRLSNFIGIESVSIVDAMAQIDTNARGILFVTDNLGRLTGCITDGDIRRWILKTGDIHAPVAKAMNHNPKYLFMDERAKSVDLMHRESITALPLINIKMEVCDLILLSETSDESCIKAKRDLSDVPVVVMAGGKGTRLYPYTKILPKPLIPIGDTPIVERIIDCFTQYGIHKYYMTVNYKKEMIKAYFAELNPGYDIEYVEEPKPLGTGGSIKLIKDVFEKPLFVTNCDALILADYGDMYDYHMASGNDITMISSLKNFTIPYGVVHTGDNGELLSMEEKPKLSYFIYSGMYIINPETIKLIPDDTLFHMTHLVDAVIKQGGKVGAYPISEDSFLDMGEFSEMKRMEEKLHIVSE
jgi:dTDP-glucose pyrophosphorylase/CBS domain-containing protein